MRESSVPRSELQVTREKLRGRFQRGTIAPGRIKFEVQIQLEVGSMTANMFGFVRSVRTVLSCATLEKHICSALHSDTRRIHVEKQKSRIH